jgi:DNA polymerase III delta prime subunit
MPRQLMKYNPAFLTEEELIRSFAVRQVDLEMLLDVIRQNIGSNSNQHILLIGPRGIGKTTLALRIAAEVRRDTHLFEHWHPIVFGEEAYEVCSPGELWLEALFHLSEEGNTHSKRWMTTYADLKSEQDETRLHDRALANLMDFADEQGKRILLIVENFQEMVGQQLTDEDGWRLRDTLMNEPRVMLLGTSEQGSPAVLAELDLDAWNAANEREDELMTITRVPVGAAPVAGRAKPSLLEALREATARRA